MKKIYQQIIILKVVYKIALYTTKYVLRFKINTLYCTVYVFALVFRESERYESVSQSGDI